MFDSTELIDEQRRFCAKHDALFQLTRGHDVLGLSRDFDSSVRPIHGLRHPRFNDRAGWYIWSGEWSDADDFFEPVHAHHLEEVAPMVLAFLGLAEGWRFLWDGEYLDVWFDAALLLVD